MASKATLERRAAELHINRTLCGPYDQVTRDDGTKYMAPVINKPFTARNGHKYVYNQSGELCRLTNKRPSRKALKRRLGGKVAVHIHKSEQRMLAAERGE